MKTKLDMNSQRWPSSDPRELGLQVCATSGSRIGFQLYLCICVCTYVYIYTHTRHWNTDVPSRSLGAAPRTHADGKSKIQGRQGIRKKCSPQDYPEPLNHQCQDGGTAGVSKPVMTQPLRNLEKSPALNIALNNEGTRVKRKRSGEVVNTLNFSTWETETGGSL